MTETHKAAVEDCRAEFEDWAKKNGLNLERRGDKNDYDSLTTWYAWKAWFKVWNTLTLKQPSSVEVTVEKKQYYRSREFYIEYFASVLCRMDDLDPKRWREGSETFEWTEFEQHAECILDAILQDFPSALRITRAAATDGVK